MNPPQQLPSGHRPLLHAELRGITKRFPGVTANDGVSLDVRAGEIHALLGENGAGKSTLMKILYGLYQPDEGEIVLDGKPARFESPAQSLAAGIGMIHQHFMLVQTLTVAENVALGVHGKGVRLDLNGVRERLRQLSTLYGLKVDPDAFIWQLSVGEQQRVEILKALYHGGALIILDEPTAVLTPQEVRELSATLKQMREQGHALIFISHKLHEVLDLSDRITVIRDGRVVDTVANDASIDRRKLARMMVGREMQPQQERAAFSGGPPRLQVENLQVLNDQRRPCVHDATFTVHGGEILGIAGVSGNGQRELAEALVGLRQQVSGHVSVDQADVTRFSVAKRLNAGLAYVPEERNRHGVVGSFSVGENAILQTHGDRPFSRGPFFDFGAIARHTRDLISAFNIKTPGAHTLVKNLSGGNVQKLILARELSRHPAVLIAAQPTRGVDISATEYIHQVLLRQRSEGVALVVISEDLDEILALSDRIAVMYEGRIAGILDRADADLDRLGLMMAGVQLQQ